MEARDFPPETYAFMTATDGTMGYSTPLMDRRKIDTSVKHYSEVEKVSRVLVATYRLESVEVVYQRDAAPEAGTAKRPEPDPLGPRPWCG